MEDDFFEPPKKLLREYVRHGAFLILDVIFLLFWLLLQAAYHVASEWIINRIGVGVVDRTVKVLFDGVFAGTTFIWVIKTVWRVHKEASQKKRKPPASQGKDKP